MKTACQTCVIHFVDEFEKTLIPPCNYWGQTGMSTLPTEAKKKVWDWLFSAPADELSGFHVGMSITYYGVPIADEERFENVIPGYSSMSEEDKKHFQKEFFRKRQQDPNAPIIIPEKKKERIIN